MLTHWGEMTAADFAALDERSVAILPVAATEQHGPHLPTGTDSFILQLRPDLVRMDRAVAGTWHHPEGLPPGGPSPWAWMTSDLSANGVIGDPRLASAALGNRLVERAVAGLASLLDRLAAAPWPPSRESAGS